MYKPSRFFAIVIFLLTLSFAATAQTGKEFYDQVKTFSLTGGKLDVTGLSLKRDRLEMNFTGTFYFPAAVDGKITGAVFMGRGNFRTETPKSDFERANLKRLIGVEDAVESDFTNAVLRFSDDTASALGTPVPDAVAPAEAAALASKHNAKILEETAANLAARITLSVLNRESPGFFFATFNGGKRGRFSCLFDPQTRIPTDFFDINAGEKGLIFKYDSVTNGNDVWMAFHSLADYASGLGTYSDNNNLIDIFEYNMDIDITEPSKRLGLKTRVKMASLFDRVRAIPFLIGESLGEYDDTRRKKQMRLKLAKLDGKDIEFVQEDWEGGFTLLLPDDLKNKQIAELSLEMEGDFLRQPDPRTSYPLSNTSWYPRHGYLDRATYKLSFRHKKDRKVASVGVRQSEGPADDPDFFVTTYEMPQPISFATFALGPFKRYTEMVKWDKGEKPIPLEFNSVEDREVQEGLIMAEMNNSVRYFHQLFGEYPYANYSATYHPYGFGQGFPSMLMIPATNRANKFTYSFIAHETAHQWWGNIVAWRSYRDQWLSEGFAEYSGVIYTNLRKDVGAGKDLIDDMRQSLKLPPETIEVSSKGKLYEIGPIILGHRLSSKKTLDGYQTLVYNKGALVLRMLHFLFTDPNTGEGEPFYRMMRDFVGRYRNQTASTDDFRVVANEHFVKTPIAARYRIKDLDWFFQQWVHQTHLPSYRLEYTIEDQPSGGCIVKGNVIQEDAPADWFMPMPLVFKFPGDKFGQGTVAAYGTKQPFQIKLSQRPTGVELDPRRWVLSDKTSTKEIK